LFIIRLFKKYNLRKIDLDDTKIDHWVTHAALS